MAIRTMHAVALSTAMLLGGCSFTSDALWPSLTGDSPTQQTQAAQAPGPQQIPVAASEAERNPQPTFTPPAPAVAATAPGVAQGPSTGTSVGQKVQQLRGELAQLQNTVARRSARLHAIRNTTTQNSQRYHGTVAAITTRLQIGTTPGNPVLINQWNQAQSDLDQFSADIAALSSLSNEIAGDAAMAAYILEAAKATYALSGAVEEDHRQLAILEDETNRTVVLIDRLLNEVSEDVRRQSSYVAGERANLSTLSLAIKNGELYGPSLSNRAYAATLPTAAPVAADPGPRNFAAEGRQPLVIIRFDRPDVPYQQALYNAVSRALERRPQAGFDLVAVQAAQGGNQNQSRRNAERVLRSLSEMGLPADRVNLSATSSAQAVTNEVHLYVR